MFPHLSATALISSHLQHSSSLNSEQLVWISTFTGYRINVLFYLLASFTSYLMSFEREGESKYVSNYQICQWSMDYYIGMKGLKVTSTIL